MSKIISIKLLNKKLFDLSLELWAEVHRWWRRKGFQIENKSSLEWSMAGTGCLDVVAVDVDLRLDQ